MRNKTLTLVAAMGRNGGIGLNGELPWHLPAELQHFKKTTMGKPVLMGRKTYAAIGRPLPGRQNLILSRNKDFRAEGCQTVSSLVEAIETAEGDELMIIGGGELYAQAMPLASRMVLTTINLSPECDTWFPSWDPGEWVLVEAIQVPADARNSHDFEIMEWMRRS